MSTYDLELTINLGQALREYPNANWVDALSRGQLESKDWLIQKLRTRRLGNVGILGCWYGILPAMMEENEIHRSRADLYFGYDIDNDALAVARIINPDHQKFIWFNMDINDANFHSMDTIINTSCEHMTRDWFDKVPDGKLVVLQSNNFVDCEGHINCVEDDAEMRDMYPMSNLLFQGTLELIKYNRFMLIGNK